MTTHSAAQRQALLSAYEDLRVADVRDGLDTCGYHRVGSVHHEVRPLWRTCAYGIASTKKAKKTLEDLGIPLFEEGVISGVAGVLLNEGKRRNWEGVSILAEAKPNFPDARAAAQVIETLTKIIPHLEIDVEPLYSEAELIEEKIKNMHKQAGPTTKKSGHALPQMYG